MTAPVEFFFDFASPYGYLASERIEGIASRHGRFVRWRPFLVGATMKVSERKPLVSIPLIGNYAGHDIERFSRYWNILLAIPSHWPIAMVAACRALDLVARTDQAAAVRLAETLYRADYPDDRDISVPETVVAISAETGLDPAHLVEGIQSEDTKQAVRVVNDEALNRGVFGSPFIIVDSEAFWGAGRLEQVDQWLFRGGW